MEKLYVYLVIATVFDMVSTEVGLFHGAHEINPIYTMTNLPLPFLYVVKILFVIILGWWCYIVIQKGVYKNHGLIILVMVIVLIWHCVIIINNIWVISLIF